VGGRFSSLTAFGLGVPAILDQDLGAILFHTEAMIGSCDASSPAPQNPGLQLGAALAVLMQAGHDKLTLCLSKELSEFGPYLQQLVDESLGKQGKGLVVVDKESVTTPEKYGNDRIFVSMNLTNEKISSRLSGLVAEGHPHIQVTLDTPEMIGQQFFLWQMAVATAAHLLEINPFDQPDVELSKELSREFLSSDQALDLSGPLADETLLLETEQALVYGQGFSSDAQSLESMILEFAAQGGSGAYVALLAYLDENSTNTELLESLRMRVRNSSSLATTLDFGPSYLHASGQLHKGGNDRGQFVVMTSAMKESDSELARLLCAQAAGDIQALRSKGRSLLRVQLKTDLKSVMNAS
jgi:transaldolase/glucose-6-phosphate isomerase